LSLATLSYYQTFLDRQVELKVGYLANVVEYWGPFLAGNRAGIGLGTRIIPRR
jgi:porin